MGMIVLIVRLLAFVFGGVVAAGLRVQLKWSLLWAMVVGIAVYVASDDIVEWLLFGRLP
jgi:hypothetical protein